VVDDTTPELGGDLDCNNKALTEVKTVSYNSVVANGTKSANFSVTWSNGKAQSVTLQSGTYTMTLTNPSAVGTYILSITNGGTATLTWAASSGAVHFPGGTAPDLTSSGTDLVTLYFNGTNWLVISVLDLKAVA
jgi:hypothetical protein